MIQIEQLKHPSGMVFHYTTFESLKSIVEGKRIRLTKYDRIPFTTDEGKEIFEIIIKVIDELKGKHISEEDSKFIKESLKGFKEYTKSGKTKRYFKKYGKFIDCYGYVFCLTVHLDKHSKGVRPSILDQEVRISFDADSFKSNEISRLTNVLSDILDDIMEFRYIDYDSKTVHNMIKQKVVRIIENNKDIDTIIEKLWNIIDVWHLSILPNTYKDEKEIRLAIYLPVDEDLRNEICNCTMLDAESETRSSLLETDYDDASYLYLNIERIIDTLYVHILCDEHRIRKELSDLEKVTKIELIVTDDINYKSINEVNPSI